MRRQQSGTTPICIFDPIQYHGSAARLLLRRGEVRSKKETRRMPMRQTIGISLALLMMSTGAIAKSPDKTAAHHPADPATAKSGKSAIKHIRHAVLPCRSAQRRQQGRQVAQHAAPHRQRAAVPAGGAPDALYGATRATGPRQVGVAAWYGLVGGRTASGERLDTVSATAAHRSLPLYSYARVTNLESGRSVVVKINDRGPHSRQFIIDLSPGAAEAIDMRRAGTANVIIEPVTSEPRATVAVYRGPGIAAAQ
jgi:rare lipoprotein A